MQTKQSMYHNDVDIRSCNNGQAHNLGKLRLFSTPPMMANHWCSMLFALDRGVFTPLNIMNRARMDLNQTDHFCGWRMVILVLQIWPSAEEGFTFLDNILWKPQKNIYTYLKVYTFSLLALFNFGSHCCKNVIVEVRSGHFPETFSRLKGRHKYK